MFAANGNDLNKQLLSTCCLTRSRASAAGVLRFLAEDKQ